MPNRPCLGEKETKFAHRSAVSVPEFGEGFVYYPGEDLRQEVTIGEGQKQQKR
jgi:hypothetical protein